MRVSIIAAVAANRVIGKDNDLAWHLPEDMAFFKRTTKGRTVIMGRKNYESIPPKFRPLPGRHNIVISRNPDYPAPHCTVVTSLEKALKRALENGEDHAFIIGGGEIYRLALEAELVDDMYLTEVDAAIAGDTFFPEFEKHHWQNEVLLVHPADERHAHPFVIRHFF